MQNYCFVQLSRNDCVATFQELSSTRVIFTNASTTICQVKHHLFLSPSKQFWNECTSILSRLSREKNQPLAATKIVGLAMKWADHFATSKECFLKKQKVQMRKCVSECFGSIKKLKRC